MKKIVARRVCRQNNSQVRRIDGNIYEDLVYQDEEGILTAELFIGALLNQRMEPDSVLAREGDMNLFRVAKLSPDLQREYNAVSALGHLVMACGDHLYCDPLNTSSLRERPGWYQVNNAGFRFDGGR